MNTEASPSPLRISPTTGILEIVGDMIRVRASGVALGDLAIVENVDGVASTARVVSIDHDIASLQVFTGGKGLSTRARVFHRAAAAGHLLENAGPHLQRCRGADRRQTELNLDPRINVAGPTVNPTMRVLASNMIETEVPMIDLFNTLVESQKIPIFSVAGEPFNTLLARIGFQADADVVVFGGMGLIFDDYHFFRTQFEEHGVFHRTVMYVNQASDPIVERLNIADMALAVACERFAVEENKRCRCRSPT
ncbi:MAG: hypothetical protein R3E50_15660 [Halioglobus sp.]